MEVTIFVVGVMILLCLVYFLGKGAVAVLDFTLQTLGTILTSKWFWIAAAVIAVILFIWHLAA